MTLINRRIFLTGGISAIALSRVEHALGDSSFFEGNVPSGPILPFWERQQIELRL
jgi:hypothetical protein